MPLLIAQKAVPRAMLRRYHAMGQALKIPLLAPSLGSVETLITQPALTSHAGLTPEEMQVST